MICRLALIKQGWKMWHEIVSQLLLKDCELIVGHIRDSQYLCERPPDGKELLKITLLHQLAFNVRDEFFALYIYLVLRIEERTPFFVALPFQRFDLLLPS